MDKIERTSVGVWDVYQDLSFRPATSQWPAFDALPFFWRMLNDVARIPGCWPLLVANLLLQLITSFIPALQLACSGRLINVVQTAVDHRTVDPSLLLTAVGGAFLCSVATPVLHSLYSSRVVYPLNLKIKAHYSVHIYHAMARLDVPTFDDPAVQRQIQQSIPHASQSTAFAAIGILLETASAALQLISQLSVLAAVLRGQPDGPLLASLCCIDALVQWRHPGGKPSFYPQGVWLATTKDNDYIRSEGLKRTVQHPEHRNEIVASGIAPFLLAQYRQTLSSVSHRADDFYALLNANFDSNRLSWVFLLSQSLRALPEIVFVLRAVRQPASIPVSLTSLHLITGVTHSFASTASHLVRQSGRISDRLDAVKQLYQVINIPNRVRVHPVTDDGDQDTRGTPFPENDKTLAQGISIQFSAVSFKYPGSDHYALRNVSFKIERGQLCVIVGNNGSGKSTILKLIARLYDPTEGTILVDGADIKTLRLADLRRATSVLFQDYTHFPLSIKDNIGLGNPEYATDTSKIERAAQLGGADALIERLSNKYDTFLERPVRDCYSGLPEGTIGAGGTRVDFSRLREAAGLPAAEGGGGVGNLGLSGGQMQRIALSRMFMRSVVSDESVGLLLFDEPSASLDPTAEHDLFERLRTLRGDKTMIFSSHRFGNLTRHADLILYMHESAVVEEGTHERLVRRGGEYARIWKLQAQAFL